MKAHHHHRPAHLAKLRARRSKPLRRSWCIVAASAMVASLGGTIAIAAVPAPGASAQPLNETTLVADSFTGASTLAGTPLLALTSNGSSAPCLTADPNTADTPIAGCTSNSVTDPDLGTTNGALQLTSDNYNQNGGVLYDSTLPFADGLDIHFTQYQYGTPYPWDADGIGFFISSAPPLPSAIGGVGGSCGYNGMEGGYLGICLDTYGNFLDSSSGGSACATPTWDTNTAGPSWGEGYHPNTVSVRGPGTPGQADSYCLLTSNLDPQYGLGEDLQALGSSDTLQGSTTNSDPTASVSTSAGRSGSGRLVHIVVDPAAGTYTISVDFTGTGSDYTTVVDAAPLPTPYPSRVTFGFAASTGGADDVHAISDLQVATYDRPAPTLSLSLADSGGGVLSAGPASYSLQVGVAPTSTGTEGEPVTVTGTLPAGVTADGNPTVDGLATTDCSVTGATFACTLAPPGGGAAPGTSLGNIEVPVLVGPSVAAGSPLVATATVVSSDALQEVAAQDSAAVTSFTEVATPTPDLAGDALSGVSCISNTDCTAVGSAGTGALIEHFDGASWSVMTAPPVPGARQVNLTSVSCAASNACMAVGWYQDDYSDDLPLAELYDGTSWQVQSTLPDISSAQGSRFVSLSAVSCPDTTHCMAVGDYSGQYFGYYALALQWTSGSWTAYYPPDPGQNYTIPAAVSCYGSTCMAVGSYGDTGSEGALALQWNGSYWYQSPGLSQPGATNNSLSGVSCVSESSCVALGYSDSFYGESGATGEVVQVWNASTWSPTVDSSPTVAGVSSISCITVSECLTVGTEQPGPGTVTAAATFNGSTLTAVATPDPAGTASGTHARNALSSISCPSLLSCMAVGNFAPVDPSGPAANLPERTLAMTLAPGPFQPGVDVVTPAYGVLDGGTSLTIKGAGFTGATQLDFGSVPATSWQVQNDSTIVATAPACGCQGAETVDLSVVAPAGTSATGYATDQFTYVGSPTVGSISPDLGAADGGTSVVIHGQDLSGVTGVDFASTPAEYFRDVSATEVDATSPAGSGTVDITVTNVSGTSAASSADQFTYVPQPVVSSVTPALGPDTGGTSVQVDGAGFTGATEVELECDDTAALRVAQGDFTVVSDSVITFDTPASTYGGTSAYDGPCYVIVTGPGGTSGTGGSDVFTYVAASATTTVPAATTTVLAATTTVPMTTTTVPAGTTTTAAPGTTTTTGAPGTTITTAASGTTTTAVTTTTTSLASTTTQTPPTTSAPPPAPQLSVDGPASVGADEQVDERIGIADASSSSLDGPLTLTLDFDPSFVKVKSVAAGWQCPTDSLGVLVCTTNTALAGTAPPHVLVEGPVVLEVAPGGLPVGATVQVDGSLDGTAPSGLPVGVKTSAKIAVGPGGSPAVITSVHQTAPVLDTKGGTALVDFMNVGSGATSSGFSVQFPSMHGAAIDGASGPGWDCSVSPAGGTWACTRADPIPAGQGVPAVTVELVTTDQSTVQAMLAVRASDPASAKTWVVTDPIALEHTTSAVLGLVSSLPLSTLVKPSGVLEYDLAVTNHGTAPEEGDLELTYDFPAGAIVTVVPARGSLWDCSVSKSGPLGAEVLECARPAGAGALAPGRTSPKVAVTVQLPPSLPAGKLVLSGHAQSGVLQAEASMASYRASDPWLAHESPRLAVKPGTTGLISAPTVGVEQATGLVVKAPIDSVAALQLAPDNITIETSARRMLQKLGQDNGPGFVPGPLQRDEPGWLLVDVTNVTGPDQPAGAVVGLVLPPGVAPLGQAGCSSATEPAGAPIPVECAISGDIPVGGTRTMALAVDVGPTAGASSVVVAGVLPAAAATTRALLSDASSETYQGPSASLSIEVQGIKAVAALQDQPYTLVPSKVAGVPFALVPPQVTSLTRAIDQNGNPTWQNTVVTLDGSKSTGNGNPLSYVWAELAGPPPVLPLGDAGGGAVCTGSLPDTTCHLVHLMPGAVAPLIPAGATVFFGEHPQVQLPVVHGSANVRLTFELFVTDGSLVAGATTQVDEVPSPDRPPVISSASATASGGTTGVVASYHAPTELTAGSPGTPPPTPDTPKAIVAGTCVSLSASAFSPDHESLSWRWSISVPGTPPTALVVGDDATCPPATGSASYGFAWPSGYSSLIATVTVTDAYGGSTTQTLHLGVPAPPLTVTFTGLPSEPMGAGSVLTVTGTTAGGDGSTVSYTWAPGDCSASGIFFHHTGGQAPPAVTVTSDLAGTVTPTTSAVGTPAPLSTSATLQIPAATGPGQTAPVCLSVSQGGESPAFVYKSAAIPLASPPALSVSVSAAKSSIATGANDQLTASTSGGVAPYSYSWSAPGGAFSPNGSTVAGTTQYIAPETNGSQAVSVTVTDSTGKTATARLPLEVGSAPAVTATGCTAAGSLLAQAANALASTASKGTDLSVTMGWGTADLGTAGGPGPTVTGSVDCTQGSATVSFTSASFSIGAGLLTGTGISGTVSARAPAGQELASVTSPDVKVCLTGGKLSLPSSWGIGQPAAIPSSGLCLDGGDLSGGGGFLSGSVQFDGVPLLPLSGNPLTTVTFDGAVIMFAVKGQLLGGEASLTGCFNPDPSALAGVSGCYYPSAASSLGAVTTLQASLSGAKVFGQDIPTSASGYLVVPASGAPEYGITFSIQNANYHGLDLSEATLTLDNSGLSLSANATVGSSACTSPALELSLSGTLADTDNWAVGVTGHGCGSLTSHNGTQIDLSNAKFAGGITDSAGNVTFDVTASLAGGPWTVFGRPSGATADLMDVDNLSFQVSDQSAPSSCTPPSANPGATSTAASVVDAGDVWMNLSGSGTVAIPGTGPIQVGVTACVDMSTGHFLFDGALSNWQPEPGTDVTLNQANVAVSYTGSDLSVVATGNAEIAGVQLGASLTVQASPDPGVVIEAYGSLGSLGPGTGYVIFTTVEQQDYPIADATGKAVGTIPNLPANSLTIALDFPLPTALAGPCSATPAPILCKIGVTGPTAIVVYAQISSSGLDLVGELSTTATLFCIATSGGNGGGNCSSAASGGTTSGTTSSTTSGAGQTGGSGGTVSMTLRDLFFEVSADGTLGLGADTYLQLPDPSDASQSATLDLRAEIAVQLPAKISASFQVMGKPGDHPKPDCSDTSGSYTDATGEWCNAFFVPGLDISTFAIQGSVDFSTGVPTPNIGMFASDVVLPALVAKPLGIQPGASMTFGFNISATDPILDIQLGAPGGPPFMKPLSAFGQPDALVVDYADLYFAPIGGQIGGTPLAPGIALAFKADIFGDPVQVDASVDPATFSISGDLSVGTIPIPTFGIQLEDVNLAIALGPKLTLPTLPASAPPCATGPSPASVTGGGFYFSASGEAALISGGPSVCLSLGAELVAQGSISSGPPPNMALSVFGAGSIDNVGLGSLTGDTSLDSILSVHHLGLSLTTPTPAVFGPGQLTDLSSAVSSLVPSVQISVQGSAKVLGTPFSANGTVQLGSGGLTMADLTLEGSPLRVGGLTVSGTGCSGNGPGPCLQLCYHCSASPTSYFVSANGSIRLADGVSTTVNGKLTPDGVSFTGDLDLTSLIGTPVAVSGAAWWGPTPDLTSAGDQVVTDTPCDWASSQQGNCSAQGGTAGYVLAPAHQGDWWVDMGVTGSETLGGIPVQADFGAGSVDGNIYLHAAGSIVVSTSSLAGTGLDGNLDASFGPAGLGFDFSAKGQVVLNGYHIGSATADLRSSPTGTVLSLSGSASLPTVDGSGNSGSTTVQVAGTLAMGDGSSSLQAPCQDPNGDVGTDPSGVLAFCLYANIPAPGISLFGANLTGSLLLDNQGFNVNGSIAGFAMTGGFNTDGTLWASVASPQNFTFDGVGLTDAQIGFCADTPQAESNGGGCPTWANEQPGVWLDGSFEAGGFDFTLQGRYTDASDYSLTASVYNLGGSPSVNLGVVVLGATISYAATVTITQNGLSSPTLTGPSGTGQATAQAWDETPTTTGNLFQGNLAFGWSSPNDLGSVGLSLASGQACATVSALGQTATVCA